MATGYTRVKTDGSSPVYYTHLDVYKRQVVNYVRLNRVFEHRRFV